MNPAAESQIQDFLDHLHGERRMAAPTIKAYQRDLAAIAEVAAERRINGWRDLTPHDVRALVASKNRDGLAPRSLQRMLSALRSFYRWAIREGIATTNPAAGISAPKAGRRLPDALEIEQANQLVEIPVDDAHSARDRAILELFYSSGLRLAELVNLNLQDVNLGDGQMQVTGKGSKTRMLPIGRHAREAIKTWLQWRGDFATSGEQALFVSQRGSRLGERSVQQRMAAWAQKQGLGRNVHPHMLRHSFASHMLQSSGDLRAVQELLGHADISTTQIYTHLDFQHLAKVYDAAHPRAKKGSKSSAKDD